MSANCLFRNYKEVKQMKNIMFLAVIFVFIFSTGIFAESVKDCPIESKIDMYLSHGKHIGLNNIQIKELKAIKSDMEKLHSRFDKVLTADQKEKCEEMCTPREMPKLEGYHREMPDMPMNMQKSHH